MNKNELNRKLCSVGKSVFVSHFQLFSDLAAGKISREDAIEILQNLGVSNEAGASICCSNAKLIFRDGLEKEALHIVSTSRVSVETREQALQLLTYCPNDGTITHLNQ